MTHVVAPSSVAEAESDEEVDSPADALEAPPRQLESPSPTVT